MNILGDSRFRGVSMHPPLFLIKRLVEYLMFDGKVIRVNKVHGGENERFVVQFIDSQGKLAWQSAELDRRSTTDQLLEIGLPGSRVELKFQQAEAAFAHGEVEA